MARILHALAHPARLEILRMLHEEEPGARSIVRRLQLSDEQVGRHLKLLKEARIIGAGKRNGFAFYRLVPQSCTSVNELIRAALAPIAPLNAPEKDC